MKFPKFNFRKRIEQERAAALKRYINEHISDRFDDFKDYLKRQKEQEELGKKLEEEKRLRKLNNHLNQDKYKIVYDPFNELSKVYVNGQEMKGISGISYEVKGDIQIPFVTLTGYGSIEAVTENDND